MYLFATFSTYGFYLPAHVEFSPEHLLCFEAVAVSPCGNSSPPVVFAPFARTFLSPDWAPAPAQVGCACMLLNIVQIHEVIYWIDVSYLNGYYKYDHKCVSCNIWLITAKSSYSRAVWKKNRHVM